MVNSLQPRARGVRLYFEKGLNLKSTSFPRRGETNTDLDTKRHDPVSADASATDFPLKISFSLLLIPLVCENKETKRKTTACVAPTSPPASHTSVPAEKAFLLLRGISLSIGFFLLFHVQEDDAEHEESNHHGEGTGVVGVRRGDETFVLGVLERTDGHLGGDRASLSVWQPSHPYE